MLTSTDGGGLWASWPLVSQTRPANHASAFLTMPEGRHRRTFYRDRLVHGQRVEVLRAHAAQVRHQLASDGAAVDGPRLPALAESLVVV